MRRHRIRSRRESVQYTQDDLIHTSIPPYDFYHLKPGARGKGLDKKEADHSILAHGVWLWLYTRLFPLESNDFSYLYRMWVEMWAMCPHLWIKYILLEVFKALLPSASLFFSGQMFAVIQSAVDRREIDQFVMVKAALGVAVCSLASRTVGSAAVSSEIQSIIGYRFIDILVSAWAHMDVPTSKDRNSLAYLASQRLDEHSPWKLASRLISYLTTAIQLATQVWMLVSIFREQPGAFWLVLWSFAGPIIRKIEYQQADSYAVVRDRSKQRKETISKIVDPSSSRTNDGRQELVANNLGDYFTRCFQLVDPAPWDESSYSVWMKHRRGSYNVVLAQALRDALNEAPKIAFAFQALRTPAQIPLSLTTLTVVQSQVEKFTSLLFGLLDQSVSIQTLITSAKELSSVPELPNLVKDGYKPIEKEGRGVSIEFKNVYFRYPGKDTDALSDVSFRLEPGALCVVVGGNGEGKSSILKLLARIYDPTEGEILLDDEPIRNYLLSDLRRMTSVLFQDYHNFPLSIEENIRVGDVDVALASLDASSEVAELSQTRIDRAAQLGGASEMIASLPKGMKTIVEGPPESWQYAGPRGGDIYHTMTKVYEVKNLNSRTGLSGGQHQRLALARTFMKPPEKLSLLIYDEPSASLDPQAEYDLFERVKALRQDGRKTMIFSTHRFGNLNKHADIILFIKNSTVVESGTHAELIARQGSYAHLYQLQAQAFL